MKSSVKAHQSSLAASKILTDFSDNSTVHGVKYLGEKQRHWSERAFWILAFLISVLGCSIMIQKIYNKWQHSPVIVSLAEKPTPVWYIPFPAVTVCPETKVLSEFLNLTAAYRQVMSPESFDKPLSAEELKILEALTQVCDTRLFQIPAINSSLKQSEIVPLLQKIAPKLSGTIPNYWWRNDDGDSSGFVGMKFLVKI